MALHATQREEELSTELEHAYEEIERLEKIIDTAINYLEMSKKYLSSAFYNHLKNNILEAKL